MAGNELNLIEPKVLNGYLTLKPYGVEEWGFALKTGQVSFVEVTDFGYPPSVYLRAPVVLGMRLPSGVAPQAASEHEGVFVIEDAQENILCTARWRRHIGDVWEATFHDKTQRQIGKASGTVGTHTSPQFVEAALVAMVRHSAAKYAEFHQPSPT